MLGQNHTFQLPASNRDLIPFVPNVKRSPVVPHLCPALTRLAEGPMVAAQLTDVDADQVRIGMSVEMVTRKLQRGGEQGTIIYGYKFRPAIRHAA
ncbi:MAG: OB-fold domain-containing protein [Anaerolineae bacterium]|nr:OB-fold domain-containing protein [Anaerolineae bacterium]